MRYFKQITEMADDLYIKHARVVNHDSIQDDVSIYIEQGIIKFIGKESELNVQPTNCRVIDASGKYVIPGGIDPHTHFELEFGGTVSVDDFYHGTRAAVAGGTTTIIDVIRSH
jgi:dihydropyrimidinase